ncbi:MAG: glucosamine-6-phosphate deaminase, partial [Lachnospiraceae bacterium]|nr:glucosamine-6-phosphate deaminase [Lachnospiraceae bacterium]
NKTRTFLPDGTEPDSKTACENYNEILRAVGDVDLQLLGLGHNGHIGFNEPGESFSTETHCIDLSEQTIKANARFFETLEEVPRQAYTMGVKTIMSARRILIIVSGEDKAEIVKRAFFGPITPQVPASILQLHRNVTLVADEAALSKC